MKNNEVEILRGKAYEAPICEIVGGVQCERGLCLSSGGVGADDLEDGGTVGFW